MTQRRPARVTQAEIARAIRAIAQVGLPAEILIEEDGTIKIVPKIDTNIDMRREVAKLKEITL
jgi:hypothetical protein